jgi:hypothetical protein
MKTIYQFISALITEIKSTDRYKYFSILIDINDNIDELSIYTFCKYFIIMLNEEKPDAFYIILRCRDKDFTVEFTKDSEIYVYDKFNYQQIKINEFEQFLSIVESTFKKYFN